MSYIETKKVVMTILYCMFDKLVNTIMAYIDFPKYKRLFKYSSVPSKRVIGYVSITDQIENNANCNSYIFNKKNNYILYLDTLNGVTPEQRKYIRQKIKECPPNYENEYSPRIYIAFFRFVYEIDNNYIGFIPKKYQTPTKCLHAFDYHCSNIQYMPKSIITREMAYYAFDVNMENFKFIPNCFKTQTMCEIVVKYHPQFLLNEIPKKFITDAMCVNIVNIDGKLVRLEDYDSNYLNEIISSDHLRRKFISNYKK